MDASELAKAGLLPCPLCDGKGSVSAEQVGFGYMVVAARKLSKMTQQELADAVGISRAAIANIEAGRAHIPIEAVRKYATALHINPTDLLP